MINILQNNTNNKYRYSYENTSAYCYPNTTVLINKLNIINEFDLFNVERELVSFRTLELDFFPIKGNLDFQHLKDIHKHLFTDIYFWSGKSRTVDIAKKNLFCLVQHIDSYAHDIFNTIELKSYLFSIPLNEKIHKLTTIFSDINALHPFREGNGRAQREFIICLAKVNGIILDFSKISQDEMIEACYLSVNGDNSQLQFLFEENHSLLSTEDQKYFINSIIKEDKIKSIAYSYL